VQDEPGTLYVNANVSAACNGETPCFTSIQRANQQSNHADNYRCAVEAARAPIDPSAAAARAR
jgi:hypothetical protein